MNSKFLHVANEDSDQIVRMHRLIRVFVRRTCQKVCFLTLRPTLLHADDAGAMCHIDRSKNVVKAVSF